MSQLNVKAQIKTLYLNRNAIRRLSRESEDVEKDSCEIKVSDDKSKNRKHKLLKQNKNSTKKTNIKGM